MWRALLLACLVASSPARAQQTRPNRVVDVASTCDRSAFAVHLTLDQPFKGLVFSKDFSRECRVQGQLVSFHLYYLNLVITYENL